MGIEKKTAQFLKNSSKLKRKFGLRIKAPLFIGALVIITAVAIGTLTYIPINNNLVEKELNDLSRDAHVLSAEFRTNIDNIIINTIFLSSVPPIDGLIETYDSKEKDEQQWKKRLESLFKLTLEGREDYLQIRLISAIDAGHELIKAKRENQKVEVVPDHLLQYKTEYDYYKEPIKLKKGQIYISELDLNVENDKIEVPYKPVIRIATPVFTKENKLFGVLVINARINKWFTKLNNQLDSNKTLYIVNRHGDFLWHPTQSHRFSFLLGEPYRLANEFGTENSLFQDNSNENQVVITNSRNDQIGLGAFRLNYDKDNPEKHIGFIVTMSYPKVIEKNQNIRNLTILVGLCLSITMILVAYYFTRKLILKIGGEPEEIEKITSKIALGDLDIYLDPNDQSSTGIWASVQKMVLALRQNRENTKNQNWLKSELSKILALSQRAKSVEELSSSVLSELAILLELGCATFYVCTDHTNGEMTVDMGLFASYGLEKSNFIYSRIKPGYGLTGQCLIEGKKITLSDVPADYIQINSSLGQKAPLFVLCLPINYKSKTIAVIEFGTFHPFTQIQIEFLDQLSVNLGVSLSNIIGKFRTQSLLEESQQMSEELQAQSEELQAQSEELHAINEELEEKSDKLILQKEELQTANEELENKTNALQIQKLEADKISFEMKAAKEELEQKAKDLTETSKFKTEFLANMSHELRTPLNSLLILAKSMSKNKTGNLTADQVESAQIIYNGGLDLLNLINDILDLSKVEAGKMDINLDYLNLRDCLKIMHRHFHPSAHEKGLELHLMIDDKIPPSIISDQHRIEQILRNLLSNAIKFTQKGSITISANLLLEDSDYVSISVKDTGVGIAKEKYQSIFEAFQQADGSTSRNFGGTGLGLTISRKLALLLDGEINIESTIGEGSIFTLTLPIRISHSKQKSFKKNQIITTKNNNKFNLNNPTIGELSANIQTNLVTKKVLIIEDDLEFIERVKNKFELNGYSCIETDSNREGLKIALDIIPDVIILCLDLSEINGLDIIHHLKENLDTRHIIIYTTTSDLNKSPLLSKGSIGFFLKPATNFKIEKMFKTIDYALNQKTKNILLIENDQSTIKTISDLICNMDVQLIQVESAFEALEIISKENVDCLILEITMIDMDAIDFFDQITKQNKFDLPPSIIYSNQEITREKHNCLQKYTDTIIVKGFHSSSRLLDEISQRINSSKESLPNEQRKVIEHLHDSDKILKSKKILVVDDDVKNSFSLSKILSEKEIKVDIADSGMVALEKLKENTYDLVLMDIMMPIMDGIETIQRIRSSNNFSNIPIIALTAKAMPEDKDQCILAGANDYLTKPIDIDQLFSNIKVWLFKK